MVKKIKRLKMRSPGLAVMSTVRDTYTEMMGYVTARQANVYRVELLNGETVLRKRNQLRRVKKI